MNDRTKPIKYRPYNFYFHKEYTIFSHIGWYKKMEATAVYNPINRFLLSEWNDRVKRYENAIAPQPEDPEQDSDYLEWKERVFNDKNSLTLCINRFLVAHFKNWSEDRFLKWHCSHAAKSIKQGKKGFRIEVEEEIPEYMISEHNLIASMDTFTQWKAYAVKSVEHIAMDDREDFLFHLSNQMGRLKRYRRISDLSVMPICVGLLIAIGSSPYYSNGSLEALLKFIGMMIIVALVFTPFVWLIWAINRRIEFMEQYIKVITEYFDSTVYSCENVPLFRRNPISPD